MSRFLFWLTHHIDCAWCKRRVHRALVPLPPRRLTNSIRVPRISHTICPACMAKVVQ